MQVGTLAQGKNATVSKPTHLLNGWIEALNEITKANGLLIVSNICFVHAQLKLN